MSTHDVDQDGPGIKPRKRRSHEIDPWYKRYARDFHEGTRKLTLEERGAYSDIIDLIFMAGGPIEDDDKGIAFKLCIDVRKWKRLRARLLSVGKLYITRGHIHNARAKEVLDQREIERRSMGRRGVDRPELDPDLFENVLDFNAPRRPTSTESDLQKEDKDRKEEREALKQSKPIPAYIRGSLIRKVGLQCAVAWIDEYYDQGWAKGAKSIKHAFPGWLAKEKDCVLDLLEERGTKKKTTFSFSDYTPDEQAALLGTDSAGRPDTTLPKRVRR